MSPPVLLGASASTQPSCRLVQQQAEDLAQQRSTLQQLSADKAAALAAAERHAAAALQSAKQEHRLAMQGAQQEWEHQKAALEQQRVEAVLQVCGCNACWAGHVDRRFQAGHLDKHFKAGHVRRHFNLDIYTGLSSWTCTQAFQAGHAGLCLRVLRGKGRAVCCTAVLLN
jgi:hypothetical protein